MRLSQRRKEGAFYFAVQQSAGKVPGGEVEIAVFSPLSQGNSALTMFRTLYFEEQSQEHIDNFIKEFAYDEHYRKICLSNRAHWCRVARLYDVNARIMQDEGTFSLETLEKNCLELFHCIRRDLDLIESRPEYQKEMARVNRCTEDDLQEALALLERVENLKVSSACQGSAILKFEQRNIYLPTCHSFKAVITMSNFPQRLRNYLRSGPLGQQHLALFEENQVSADHALHNKKFIRTLTASLYAFWAKS